MQRVLCSDLRVDAQAIHEIVGHADIHDARQHCLLELRADGLDGGILLQSRARGQAA